MRESASTDLREPQGSNPLGPPWPRTLRSFPIASASSVSRAVVVVRHAKRCSDLICTGIPRCSARNPPTLTPEFRLRSQGRRRQA